MTGSLGRVFANSSGDLGSIPGRVIPKTLKMVLDTSLLNTQQYKVRIKGKVEQSRKRSSTLPLHLGVEKGAFWSPTTLVINFTFTYFTYSSSFLGKGMMPLYIHFSMVNTLHCIMREVCHQSFLFFKGILTRPAAFLFLIFFNTASNFSSVNCSGLMLS